jgi:hypothetical protein
MERSEELRDLVRTSFEAYSRGDTSFIDRHTVSHDGVRAIGSDPTEGFEGQVAEVMKQGMQEGGVTVSCKRKSMRSSRATSIGYRADRC